MTTTQPPQGTAEPRGECEECGGEKDMHYLSCSIWPHNSDRPSPPAPAADAIGGTLPNDLTRAISAPAAGDDAVLTHEAIGRAADSIRGTGSAVEIGGLRIEECDTYGQTATTRQVEHLRAAMDDERALSSRFMRERDEARQQVADLRAGVEALLRFPARLDGSDQEWVSASVLRALLAGSGEQPGECEGCRLSLKAGEATRFVPHTCRPAPVVPDSTGLRESVGRVAAYLDEMDRVNAANRAGSRYDDTVHGINDLNLRRSDLRAVLAAVGQGVTAEQEGQR